MEIDTPNITLKINIRNKQGGVYPILCAITYLNLINSLMICLWKVMIILMDKLENKCLVLKRFFTKEKNTHLDT